MPPTEPGRLSLAVLKIWAHFFKSNTQWPFINIIGKSLEKYREILQRGGFDRGTAAATANTDGNTTTIPNVRTMVPVMATTTSTGRT